MTKRHPRRVPSRAELLSKMPRGLRPMLKADQQRDLELLHLVNIDAIASGSAEPAILWDWVGGVLCWWRAAMLLQVGEPEMVDQLHVARRLVERFARTGRVLWTGPDYQAAKEGIVVMQQLAQACDKPTAMAAADWAEMEVSMIAAMAVPEIKARGTARAAA
jgi:hypothetical protein